MTTYPMCDTDWPIGVLILWAAMKKISLASMHNPICVENVGEENTLKYSYLLITVWLSPCCLRSGAFPTVCHTCTFVLYFVVKNSICTFVPVSPTYGSWQGNCHLNSKNSYGMSYVETYQGEDWYGICLEMGHSWKWPLLYDQSCVFASCACGQGQVLSWQERYVFLFLCFHKPCLWTCTTF